MSESVQIYKFTKSAFGAPKVQVQKQQALWEFFANLAAEIVWQSKLQQI